MIKKNNFARKALSLLLAALMTFTAFAPSTVLAADDNGTVIENTKTWNVSKYLYYNMNSSSATYNANLWPDGNGGFNIPFAYTDKSNGIVPVETEAFRAVADGTSTPSYCLNIKKKAPAGVDMDYTPETLDAKVMRVVNAGYPKNAKGYKGDLTDAEFEWVTQVALRIIEGQTGEGESRFTLDNFDLTGDANTTKFITLKHGGEEYENALAIYQGAKETRTKRFGSTIAALYKAYVHSSTENLPSFVTVSGDTWSFVESEWEAAYNWLVSIYDEDWNNADNVHTVVDDIDAYVEARRQALADIEAEIAREQASAQKVFAVLTQLVNYANNTSSDPFPSISISMSEGSVPYEGGYYKRGPFTADLSNATSGMLIKVGNGESTYKVVDASGNELPKTTVAGTTYYQGSFRQAFYVNVTSALTNPPITVYAADIELPTTVGYYVSDDIQTMYVYDTVTLQKELDYNPLPAYVRIKKTDRIDTLVEGAVFALYLQDSNGQYSQYGETKTTGADGYTDYFEIPANTPYYFKEISVPARYALSSQNIGESTGENPGARKGLTVRNNFTTHQFEVSKQGLGGAEIPGASMKITGIELGKTEEITPVTWTSKSTPQKIALRPGTYTLHEEVAPDGYLVATDINFSIDIDGVVTVNGTQTNTITMTDDWTKVFITKKDITGSNEVVGASLQVLDSDGQVVERWTSSSEAHKIEAKLKAGAVYTLHEVEAPEGYTVARDIQFTVNSDGQVQTVVMNDDFDYSAELNFGGRKIVSSEEYPSERFTFILKGPDGQQIDSKTITGPGEFSFDTIELKTEGTYTYTIEELDNQSAGWDYDNAIYTITVVSTKNTTTGKLDIAQTITKGTAAASEVVFENEYSPSDHPITISKLGIDSAKIGGAVLEVTGRVDGFSSDITPIRFTTVEGQDKEIELKAGSYVLHEVTPPAGYFAAADIAFTVDSIGNIQVNGEPVQSVVMEDTPTEIRISKVDIADGIELSGAHIQIIDSKDTVVEEWNSTGSAHVVKGLKIGEVYTLKETVAPIGYQVATDTTFVINENGSVTSTGSVSENGVLLIEDSLTKISILKTDITGDEELEGAHLQILNDVGGIVTEWVSTSEPKEITGLQVGKEYTLRETVAPEGYTVITDSVFLINADGSVTTRLTINNDGVIIVKDHPTKVSISKVDIASGEELAGAHLQVLDSEGTIVEEWDSVEEIHEIEGLKTGEEYTLRETVAPDGYTIATDTTFVINENGDVTSTGTVTEDGVLLVEDTKTSVSISKVDIANGEELEGATLQVIDSEGNIVEEWISTAESHEIKGLKTREEYTLRETVAPDGYTIATDTTFTIDDAGNVTSTGSITEDGILLVEDTKTNISISKVDIADGAEVEGATLQVLDSEGNVVEEWVSNGESHEIEGLLTGEQYTLRETIAPDGYTIATDTTFVIDETGKVTSTGTVTQDGVLLIEDAKTEVSISKVDIADGAELEGATLQVLDASGNVVDEWVSTNEAHRIEGLITGRVYTLKETVSPEGYSIATATTFTIDETGKVTSTGTVTEDGVLLVEDSKTKVSITKTDITGQTEIPGAKLRLFDSRGNLIDEWTSGEDAHIIEGLIVGKTYKLHEEGAPDGYAYASDVEFTVNADTATQQVVMRDEATTVHITKTDITGDNEIPGATLQVLDEEGNILDEWVSTEDVHEIVGLLIADKTYTLHEENAPNGYAYAEDAEFTVNHDGTITEVSMKDDITRVSVTKTDITGDNEIPGATLQVLDKDGNVVEEWISTEDAHEINGVLIAGETYTLHEENAPNGYAYAEDAEFTVNRDGSITEVSMKDDITRVSITKTNITGDEEIPGAHLQIIDKDGEVVEEWDSTEEAHEINGVLIAGETYTLREENAPDGYAYAEDAEFTVNRDGSITEVFMKDDVTKAIVNKVDADGNFVVGALMQILDEDGEVVHEWTTTGEEHVIEGVLIAGASYVLHEAEAPEGYAGAEDINFVINREGKVELDGEIAQAITMTDIKLGEISITKKVSGSLGEKDRQFEFTITLLDRDENPVNGEFDFAKGDVEGKLMFTDGVATFNLSDAETIIIKDIPCGYTYNVEEKNYEAEGYTTTSENEAGEISDETAQVLFKNVKGGEIATGIDLNTNQIWFMLIPALGIALLLFLKKKRKA